MARPLHLDEDRLLPVEPRTRAIARRLHGEVRRLPIISPHGHTEPAWFAGNAPFADAASLLLTPDHYLYRMLYSQGAPLQRLGVPTCDGAACDGAACDEPREAWRLLAHNMRLFRGTPSALWLNRAASALKAGS